MKHSSIVRKLGEMFRTAHDTSADGQDGEYGTRTGLAMFIDAENASPGHMDEVVRDRPPGSPRRVSGGDASRRVGHGSVREKRAFSSDRSTPVSDTSRLRLIRDASLWGLNP